MDILLPFKSGALNASMYAILIIIVPAILMAHTAITLKTPTRRKLLSSGGILILYCILIAPLLLALIDLVGDYEKEYESCQLNYIYQALSSPEESLSSLKKCSPQEEASVKELTDFKTLLVICSIMVNVVLISLGVNLIASASSMTEVRLSHDNIYEQIDKINTKIGDLSENIKILGLILGIPLLIVIIAIWV